MVGLLKPMGTLWYMFVGIQMYTRSIVYVSKVNEPLKRGPKWGAQSMTSIFSINYKVSLVKEH